MVEELARKLGPVLCTLTGGVVPVCDCYSVGQYSPDRPHPVIVRFPTADAKVAILCAKGMLYRLECPKAVHGIHVYHDLLRIVSDWSLTVTAGGKGPGCAMLIGIVVRYTRLYINGGIMGFLSH